MPYWPLLLLNLQYDNTNKILKVQIHICLKIVIYWQISTYISYARHYVSFAVSGFYIFNPLFEGKNVHLGDIFPKILALCTVSIKSGFYSKASYYGRRVNNKTVSINHVWFGAASNYLISS